MSHNYLSVSNLSHKYLPQAKHSCTLNCINFQLQEGSLLGLLGPSGSGKTTLLRLIAGFEEPCHGSISVNNKIISSPTFSLPPEERGIGMVFQDYALFPHISAWKNVCFGLKKNDNKERARWLVELLGLSEFCERYPHELSGGQKQRLALARALAPGNKLLLLDEPFSNLDVEVRLRLRSELSNVLKSCSATAILVTHDPEEALAISDYVGVINEGFLHQFASPEELVLQPSTPFVGRFVLQRNVFDVKSMGNRLTTLLGDFEKPISLEKFKEYTLLVDDSSINISHENEGNGTIIGKEFLGHEWLIRVQYENKIIRLRSSLLESLKVGNKCNLSFKHSSEGLLFPGAIKCKLT